jgi:lipase
MRLSPLRDSASACRVIREARGRVSGDGVELAFGYWPGRGHAVVAVHGLTANYVNFVGIAECLAGRLPLLAFDLRGRGDSDKPEGPYGLVQHARDIAHAMRSMGVGPSILIGHSMGAFVATALAAQDPDLVTALVLIDGGYVPATLGSGQNTGSALAARIAQLRKTYSSRNDYREFWRAQPHFPRAEWNHWLEAFLDYEVAGEVSVRPKALEAAILADLKEVLQREAIVARLRAIRVPTLMLRAERGFTPDEPPLFPDELVGEIQSVQPRIEDYKFEGTTHYTIALGEKGSARIADLIVGRSQRLHWDHRPD